MGGAQNLISTQATWACIDGLMFRTAKFGSEALRRGACAALRGDAAALSAETLRSMYAAPEGRGFFNLVFPPDAPGKPLVGWEMRHAVDFFSVTFGLPRVSSVPLLLQLLLLLLLCFSLLICPSPLRAGLCGLPDQPCDFNATTRAQLGRWFREESATSNWIRATSPRTKREALSARSGVPPPLPITACHVARVLRQPRPRCAEGRA